MVMSITFAVCSLKDPISIAAVDGGIDDNGLNFFSFRMNWRYLGNPINRSIHLSQVSIFLLTALVWDLIYEGVGSWSWKSGKQWKKSSNTPKWTGELSKINISTWRYSYTGRSNKLKWRVDSYKATAWKVSK